MTDLQDKWDTVYRSASAPASPAEVLSKHRYLLPKQGKALDLACGLGGNAILLAESGLTVEAWDISSVGLGILQQQATEKSLSITTQQCHINAETLTKQTYDVIVICRFLDRTLCNAIMAALKPGGLLFYQTFTRNKLDQQGPSNPDYLLASNELLRLFSPLNVVFYQEYVKLGDVRIGNRNEACFIGQK
ncbi:MULTISPECIES: class I SAM-dependent methyltransferase [Methylomonas]|uniref:Methyltransferase type 12 n=2 Tax=Methylomonas TaxID=416 RepID=A0A126T3Z5_9GAMM|nr:MULTISPECIES: methyltransferase domain-containing protein [Methylomonas]AMK76806.1 methyltransferase type 12 [Methylomonas denitrificans]OAI03429.1 methyltransferase type 12 [Methylomonas methanica]TCV76923.1 tellurite resistance protein TehB [Methylomonas methanica]